MHVHFREPGFSYKETIRTGSMAAARGGYTTVCAMPNLDPVPDSAEHLEEERYNVLGKVGKILFVVCAFRDENTVRLISARVAAVPEKERYNHGEDEF